MKIVLPSVGFQRCVSTSHFMLILLLAAVSLLTLRGPIHEMSLPCLPDLAPAPTNATNGAHQSEDNIDATGNTLNLPRASSIPCFAPPAASTSHLSPLAWAMAVFALGLTAIKTDFLLILMLSLVNLCKSIVRVVKAINFLEFKSN